MDKRAFRDDVAFVLGTVERSLPKADRPRLTPELERELSSMDRHNAMKYASMEAYARSFDKLADQLDENAPKDSMAVESKDATPKSMPVEDSLVTNINQVISILQSK